MKKISAENFEPNELEQTLITALFSGKTRGTIFWELVAEDFENELMRDIYRATKKLFDEGVTVEPLAVFVELQPVYGDSAELRKALDYFATQAQYTDFQNMSFYIRQLQDKNRFKFIQSAAQTLQFAESLEDAERLIGELALLSAPRCAPKKTTLGDMADIVADKINEDIEHPETASKKFIEWGFHPLDVSLRTVKGSYIVIGGRPAVGKSLLALQAAVHMALSGLKVGFFSLEMTEEELAYRATSYLSGVQMETIQDGRLLTETELKKIGTAFAVMHKHDKMLSFPIARSVEQIRALTLSGQFDVIFCDYLQIIAGGKRATERERIGEISSALRSLAHDNNVLVVVLSQLSRPIKGEERKPPVLSDLRESGSIEADANAVVLLSLKDVSDKLSDRYVQIAKNRSGPCADFYLSFDGARQTFRYVQRGV